MVTHYFLVYNSIDCLVWQISVEADTTSLEIGKVFVEDSGDYCVIARNSAGDAQTSCHVYVIGSLPRQPADAATADAAGFSERCPPGFTYIFRDLTVDVGQPCTMRVAVNGNPPPTVQLIFPRV